MKQKLKKLGLQLLISLFGGIMSILVFWMIGLFVTFDIYWATKMLSKVYGATPWESIRFLYAMITLLILFANIMSTNEQHRD